MRSRRIILPTVGAVILAVAGGCQPLGASFDSAAGDQWITPPATPMVPQTIVPQAAAAPAPIYLAPGEPEVIAPGTPIFVEPTVVLPPPGQAYPSAPTATPGGVPMAAGPPPAAEPLPEWWDVLPAGAAAISPDFGLPRGPVVENRVANPLIVPAPNNELAWDQLADVVADYFPIQREQPVHEIGGMLTEGFIETAFETGSTILEPHRNDSVGRFNRWESTLQSIRRKAFINVQPTGSGYAVGVTVIKQLEDLPRPELALAGAAVLRSDNSLPTKRRSGIGPTTVSDVWIDLGRDEPLEQEMLRRIRDRLAKPLAPSSARSVF